MLMSLLRFAAVLLVLSLSLPGNAGAQSAALTKKITRYATLLNEGQLQEALPVAEEALRMAKREFGTRSAFYGSLSSDLGVLNYGLGRHDEAIPHFKRSWKILRRVVGSDYHLDIVRNINLLGLVYLAQHRFSEAKAHFERALPIAEAVVGRVSVAVGQITSNLGFAELQQHHLSAAEPLLKRAIAILEEQGGPDSANLNAPINNLALLYLYDGRPLHEIEPLYKRALEVVEKGLGRDHPDIMPSLLNLADLYRRKGRYADAVSLAKRALAILEKAHGPDAMATALALRGLAGLYAQKDLYEEMEPLLQRALAIFEKSLGPDNYLTGQVLQELGTLSELRGRHEEAESFYRQSMAVLEAASGGDLDLANTMVGLGRLYRTQGRYSDAEPYLKRALPIMENVLGEEHFGLIGPIYEIAALSNETGRPRAALESARRATAIQVKRLHQSQGNKSSGLVGRDVSGHEIFRLHVGIIAKLLDRDPSLISEAFEVGQSAAIGATSGAVAQMAARFAAGSDALAQAVRAHQDARVRWRAIESQLAREMGQASEQRNSSREEGMQKELLALDERLAELEARLSRDFPSYRELSNPQPLKLAETRKLLGAAEALVAYMIGGEESYVWVVRSDGAWMHRVPIGRKELDATVAELRKGLDSTLVASIADIPRFDTGLAYDLYTKLFSRAERHLQGVRHVIVVPDGALQSLPLGVLVTKKPKQGVTDFADYRQVPWLARDYAVSVLPSVSALRALRRFTTTGRAKKPFAGIGDPLLSGHPGAGRGIELASLYTSRGVADVQVVRALPALPETADELRSMAKALGASEDSLFLRERATERGIKEADLSQFRILAFATHGLLAGDLTGVTEPALVLTPPKEGTARDDGLLTASEVAQLKLDADWVILSACNTAAPDGTPGAEGLSGLAKAFFYAGSRTLLVSHWPVFSDAAVRLTTGVISVVATVPGIGRAEALRRSMVTLLDDPSNKFFAHPMFWAPFAVVGEGGNTGPGHTGAPAAGLVTIPTPTFSLASRGWPKLDSTNEITGTAHITVKNSNVRAGPSVEADRVKTLPKGTYVTVLDPRPGKKWYLIAHDGKELGYIYAPLIRPVTP